MSQPGVAFMGDLKRSERLQIMLTDDELTAVDDWRFTHQMPSRASAIRELLKRGLAAEGFMISDRKTKSQDFSVVDQEPAEEEEKKRSG